VWIHSPQTEFGNIWNCVCWAFLCLQFRVHLLLVGGVGMSLPYFPIQSVSAAQHALRVRIVRIK
jgi:hypothetical protein